MGVSGELYDLLENYLSGRSQRVHLNGQTSLWRSLLAGVPQDSILGPLLLFISMIYSTNQNLMLNSLPMTHLFLRLLRIRMKVLMFSTITFSQPPHGLIIGKYFLIQILVNRIKKCCFQKKKKKENSSSSIHTPQQCSG